MGTYNIPNQLGQVRQLNQNDIFGELWATKNIDLHTNTGKIKLARPFKQVMSDDDLASKDIQAFAVVDGSAWAVTADRLYGASTPYETWIEHSSGFIDVQNAQDMVVFQSQLVITTVDDIDAYDYNGSDGFNYTSNWWTARGNTALAGASPYTTVHIMEVLRIGTETLAVTNGQYVHAYTGGIGSGAILSTTVDLGANFMATCIKANIRTAFIGAYTEDNEQSFVFEWDGASTNYTQSYPVGAKAVLAMEVVDNAPIIVVETGEIKLFNNAGFVTIAQFPFALKPLFASGVQTGLIQVNNLARPIHPKGMKRVGNVLYIYVNFDSNQSLPLDERTPSGLWALDLKTFSLNHIGSQDNDTHLETSSPLMVLNDAAGRFFMGGRKDTGDKGLWIEDLDPASVNYGYLVTSEIQTPGIKDVFNEETIKALLGEDDIINVKYRSTKDVLLPIYSVNAVWASASQLSTADDLSHIKARFDAGEFDEVEIITGTGAGRLAQITAIESSLATYDITIDEDFGVAGDPIVVRIDNFKKVPETMTLDDGDTKSFGTGDAGNFSQYKIALKGQNGFPEISGLMTSTKNKEKR